MPIPTELDALEVGCPYCRVGAGYSCRIRGGGDRSPHQARINRRLRAYWLNRRMQEHNREALEKSDEQRR